MSFIKDTVKTFLKIPIGLLFGLNIKRRAKASSSTIYLFGTPLHSNLGDQAIAYAEKKFITKYFPKLKIIEVPYLTKEYFYYLIHIVRKHIRLQDIICLHGGGNMGIEYLAEEECRRKVIQLFPEHNITIFPQTIDFGATETGIKELEKTRVIYNSHPCLTLIARENYSYQKMKIAFPENKVLRSPDIVLFLNEGESQIKRDGLTFVLRDDSEKILGEADHKKLLEIAGQHFSEIRFSNTLSSKRYIFPLQRFKTLNKKFDEFKSSNVIITDRLHGMVFSAITGTPCIALSNYNYKIQGTYDWISFLPYIKFADCIEKVPELLRELLTVSNTRSSNSELINDFECIKDSIKNGLRNE